MLSHYFLCYGILNWGKHKMLLDLSPFDPIQPDHHHVVGTFTAREPNGTRLTGQYFYDDLDLQHLPTCGRSMVRITLVPSTVQQVSPLREAVTITTTANLNGSTTLSAAGWEVTMTPSDPTLVEQNRLAAGKSATGQCIVTIGVPNDRFAGQVWIVLDGTAV